MEYQEVDPTNNSTTFIWTTQQNWNYFSTIHATIFLESEEYKCINKVSRGSNGSIDKVNGRP